MSLLACLHQPNFVLTPFGVQQIDSTSQQQFPWCFHPPFPIPFLPLLFSFESLSCCFLCIRLKIKIKIFLAENVELYGGDCIVTIKCFNGNGSRGHETKEETTGLIMKISHWPFNIPANIFLMHSVPSHLPVTWRYECCYYLVSGPQNAVKSVESIQNTEAGGLMKISPHVSI